MKRYPYMGSFEISALFGQLGREWSHPHYGIDTIGRIDKTIYPADVGTVLDRNAHGAAYGNHITISHPDGTVTLYAHLSRVYVKPGDTVTLVTPIGEEGATGHVTGQHLHFEAHWNKEFRFGKDLYNPTAYLNFPAGVKVGSVLGPWKGIVSSGPSNIVVGSSASAVAGAAAVSIAPEVPQTQFQVVGTGGNGSILFGRRYRLFVDLGGGKSFEVSDLRCTFQIVKTALLQPNQSIMTIYNLSPETEGTIIKEGHRMIIEAGYEGDQYGVIFDGDVVQHVRGKEDGVTYILTLVSMDGDRYINTGMVGVAMVAGQSQRDIVNTLAGKAANPIQLGTISEQLVNTKLPRGKVLFGLGAKYMRQLAQDNNSTFYVLDGKANIVSPADISSNEIFDLSSESGLIGIPMQTEYGVKARMLLNPRVNINSLVRINNQLVRGLRVQYGQPIRPLDEEGIYRVYKLAHIGDTRGDDWYTEIETVSQAGALPGMMAGPAIAPW
jgi:hypothetical protein